MMRDCGLTRAWKSIGWGTAFVWVLCARWAWSDDREHFFAEHVAPIFQQHCLRCHNEIDGKGDLTLETGNDLQSSGFLDAAKPAESPLLFILEGDDETPPSMPQDEPPLTSEELAAIRTWLQQGAIWPEGYRLQAPVVADRTWWSWQPIVPQEVPEFTGKPSAGWIRNPIDAFILSALQSHGLTHSEEADRRTLARRVTFDLTGLPPTPDEVEAFVHDRDPLAYERLVDRLLASPHYGERWARHWLDVVKYADTCGYDKDKLRPRAWPYRDYVIRSLNADKPYARFVEEQLAGDVLYPGTPEGILGLGFIAAGPWDFIGHVEVPESKIDGQVARNLDRDEMVTNTLNTFCSITVQCARCHNHKFDPITQRDYYQLQTIFAAVDRAERPYEYDPEVERRRSDLNSQITGVQQEVDQQTIALVRKLGITPESDEFKTLSKLLVSEGSDLKGEKRPEFGFHSQIAEQAANEKWVEVDLGREAEVHSIVLRPCHDEYAGIGDRFGFPSEFRVEGRRNPDASKVVFSHSATDAGGGLLPWQIRCSNERMRFIRVTATKLALRKEDYIFALAELQVFDKTGTNLALDTDVAALDSIEAPVRWRNQNLTDGIWPHSESEATLDVIRSNDEIASEDVSTRGEIFNSLRDLTKDRSRMAQLEKQRDALPIGKLVYAAATDFQPQANFKPTKGNPRTIHVLHRGNVQQPLEEVTPATFVLNDQLESMPELPEDHHEGDRRAALARWVTAPQHPLTWRSIVNRIWQYHFGQGLVETPNDFGRMGQLPSHPELLDWLAIAFRDRGGSLKKLHRLIVTSATYRQSSDHHEQNAATDSGNRFLWRMNRRRLAAEEIRDAILDVSGALNPQMGGPGYYLFALEKADHSPHYEYHKFDPGDAASHRRSLFRFVVRSQPDPYMTTLDCADSSQSTPRRTETLTSLQALALLNNRFNLVMAERFADRLREESGDLKSQVRRAVALVTVREPTDRELAAYHNFAQDHGLANLCRVMFNLSEFLYVD